MERFSESNEAYSTKRLKKKLKDGYSDHLYFAEINGRKNVLCFKNMANYIINENWYEKRQINDDEAKRIVITAAKLIREEIRNIKLSLDSYPNKDDITDSINENSCSKPNLFNTLLSYVVPETVKRPSICQCNGQYNYASCIVVFDGYGNGASTNDHEHRRRNKGMAFPYVKIELDMVAHNKQHDFLSNKLNKSPFISLPGSRLQTKGFIVHQRCNDADTLIVKCAIELSLAGNVCAVIADDTDILVLLMYYFQPHMADIFLFSIASKHSKSGQKIASLKNVIDATDPFIKENILFAHAWSGCNTTSSTYGHGKFTILKHLKKKIKKFERSAKYSQIQVPVI